MFYTKLGICPHCRGSGADNPDDVKTCPECSGTGYTVKRQQIAPGFFQQFQAPCDRCTGKGKIYKKKCHVCRGDKIMPGTDKIEIIVEKGVPSNHELKFYNAGDEHYERAPSDIIYHIEEIPHKTFTRKGKDLRTVIWLTLQEALLGFTKEIVHLDGHKVKITRDKVTQPGEVTKIKNEGMPIHENSSNFGDLFIEYQVKFDEKFTEEQKKRKKS